MTKEEFLKIAEEKWEEISNHKENSKTLYDYEKGFDELWVDFGRITLESSIGEVPKDRRKKKKVLSRYGQIEIAKASDWSLTDSLKISPYMRDLMLYSGQDDNYQASAEHIEKYLRIKADDSQMNRLCVSYGSLLEAEMNEVEGVVVEKTKAFAKEIGSQEVVYGMFDGCMLPTRPTKKTNPKNKVEEQEEQEEQEIGSWKEMKLGRVFRAGDHLELGSKPNIIRNSLYISHFGKHDVFTDKLEKVVDVFEPLGHRLVFINDGATWIANFISQNYPKATNILDFYHASEYLHDFSKIIFPKKMEIEQRQQWIDKQILRLLNDKVKQVIEDIEQIQISGKVKIAAQQKILTYYKNNQHRMFYKTYRESGLLIGSGPIESAHRFVLQKRLKQSGQKWTKKGAQSVANLRCVYLNNQWNRVIDLINRTACKAA